MRLDFQAMFAAHVAATQKEWTHDRSKTVGASEVFRCLRGVWFRKRGSEFTILTPSGLEVVEDGTEFVDSNEVPKFVEREVFTEEPMYPEDEDDEDSWGATRRGDLLEAHYVVPAVRDNLPKGKLLFSGADQKTLVLGNNSATPDGLIIGLDRDALADYGIPDIGTHCIALEIKSIDPRVKLEEEKAVHHGQVQVQMGIIRELTPYKPQFAVILYVDASFLDKIKVFIVEFDPNAWEVAAKSRANDVFTINDPALIPPEGKMDGECRLCEFQRTCAIVTNGSIPDDNSKEADEALLQEFDPLADEWKEKKEAADAANKEFEEMKVRIKDALFASGTRKLGGKRGKKAPSRPWSMSWYSQDGQMRLSTKLLKQALGDDLAAFKEEGNPFDVLRVSFSSEKT